MDDFLINDHGSIVILVPQTDAAKAWVTEHITDPETQHFGGGVVIEPRYLSAIVEGAIEDGLTVSS